LFHSNKILLKFTEKTQALIFGLKCSCDGRFALQTARYGTAKMVGVKGADATGVFCQDNIPEPRAKRSILSSMNGAISTVEPLGTWQ